eukprot:NODE_1418_length_1425_cov_4.780523_g1181_i0.p1 GENE.NODE_1418_length_1425_cov_4.780523_g1181_i0~~NODE_1418_length_1425_cov_4.780523_g1181_i0.p1  ORF type:complete len:405 (-),score=94.59 NODE_1418_length_1425_cov_4.780523_g1181_i0:52-1266(-)
MYNVDPIDDDNAHFPTKMLTPNDVFALFTYTYESPAYGQGNKGMRMHDTEEGQKYIKLWKPFIATCDRALRKIPMTGLTVSYRGIPIPFDASSYGIGKSFCWNSFSSTSEALKVAQGFAKREGASIVFVIEGYAGRHIAQFSHYPAEAEVLYRPNSCFHVYYLGKSDLLKPSAGALITCEAIDSLHDPDDDDFIANRLTDEEASAVAEKGGCVVIGMVETTPTAFMPVRDSSTGGWKCRRGHSMMIASRGKTPFGSEAHAEAGEEWLDDVCSCCHEWLWPGPAPDTDETQSKEDEDHKDEEQDPDFDVEDEPEEEEEEEEHTYAWKRSALRLRCRECLVNMCEYCFERFAVPASGLPKPTDQDVTLWASAREEGTKEADLKEIELEQEMAEGDPEDFDADVDWE